MHNCNKSRNKLLQLQFKRIKNVDLICKTLFKNDSWLISEEF